jgi:hypothetical protein
MNIETISTPSDVFGQQTTILSQRNVILSDGSMIHLDSDMESVTDVYHIGEGGEAVLRDGQRNEHLDTVLYDVQHADENGSDPIEAAFGDD